MKMFEQGNEWLRNWNENQKSLFQAWVEVKPPPFAVMGEPPPAGEPESQAGLASDLMRRAMEQWTTLAQAAWNAGDSETALQESSAALKLKPDWELAALFQAQALQQRQLDALLRESDFVSLHPSLTAETRHMIDARALALMKPTAFLINTARGAVVDEAALIEALAEKRIAGAGLDVYEREPQVEAALLAMPNVVLTPHLGSAVAELRVTMAHIVIDNIEAVLDGRRPPNCVNPEIYP